MTRGTAIPETVALHVPFRRVKRGGRKEMHLPEDVQVRRKIDETLIKALARVSVEEDAWVRGIRHRRRTGQARRDRTVLSRSLLRLALLAPEIVEAVLEGRQGVVDRGYSAASAERPR